MRDERFLEHLVNNPSYSKDGPTEYRDWWGDRRHFRPWYDDRADYNTNAKSYYDYLGRLNGEFEAIIEAVNHLLTQDLDVKDSSTVTMTKEGEWLNDDAIETISAAVKLATDTNNALQDAPDGGLYVKDLQPEIDFLTVRVSALETALGVIDSKFIDLQNQLNALDGEGFTKLTEGTDYEYKLLNGAKLVEASLGGHVDVSAINTASQSIIQINTCITNDPANICFDGGKGVGPEPKSALVGIKFMGTYAWINNARAAKNSSDTLQWEIRNTANNASWNAIIRISQGAQGAPSAKGMPIVVTAQNYIDGKFEVPGRTLAQRYPDISEVYAIFTNSTMTYIKTPAK